MFPCWRFFVLPDLKPPEVACTAEADGGLLSTQAQIDVTRRLINTSATEAPFLPAPSVGKSQQFGNMWKTNA